MIRTPASILYDVNGIATAVSASDQPTSGALGHVMAGFDATDSVRYATFDADSLKVTGTVGISGPVLEFSNDSVTAYQGGIFSVTGSGDVGLLRQDPSTRDLYVTGSVLVTSGAIAITDNVNGLANIETIGTRKALAVEYPLLLDTMSQILIELKRIRKHMESITEEEWSENDDI